MTLEEFIQAFAKIKQLGYVRTLRSGPTGVGHTLEQLLGLKESNIAVPDLGTVELKAHRIGSSAMITLFTLNRKKWRMKHLEAVRKFGTPNEEGRLQLYVTLSFKPSSSGIYFVADRNTLSARHESGQVLIEWRWEEIEERFTQKMPGLVFVKAKSKMQDGTEWFHYTEAQLLTEHSVTTVRKHIKARTILVDLRIRDHVTRARNHGTGFRAHEGKLPVLFDNVKDL